MIKKVKIYNSY